MSKRINVLILIALFFGISVQAQDKDVIIDKVVAIVGGNAILYSDIESQYMQYLLQGNTANGDKVRCTLLEEQLFSKLMLNQAQLDSIVVSDEQVETEMDKRLNYFINQIGSRQKLEAYYDKSILEIKNELREMIHDQLMIQQVQGGISGDVTITPSETQAYFNDIPKDSLPVVGARLQYAEIIRKPQIAKAEKKYAFNKIDGIRKRIENGEDFNALARIFSEDPGSKINGGDLGEFKRGVMYPEFEAAAFALKEKGELSPVVETQAGYHIIQLTHRKGDYVSARHILIRTKISSYSLNQSKLFLDSIHGLIKSGKYTFENAARKFSDNDNKVNGGMVLNSSSGSIYFQPQELDQKTYFALSKMNSGEVSAPVLTQMEDETQVYRILKLLSQTQPHKASLEEDYDLIQNAALEKKKAEVLRDWVHKKAIETYISIPDENFKQCDFLYEWF